MSLSLGDVPLDRSSFVRLVGYWSSSQPALHWQFLGRTSVPTTSLPKLAYRGIFMYCKSLYNHIRQARNDTLLIPVW